MRGNALNTSLHGREVVRKRRTMNLRTRERLLRRFGAYDGFLVMPGKRKDSGCKVEVRRQGRRPDTLLYVQTWLSLHCLRKTSFGNRIFLPSLTCLSLSLFIHACENVMRVNSPCFATQNVYVLQHIHTNTCFTMETPAFI